MTQEEMKKKINELQQELNQIANQLVLRSPEGQRVAGKIELLTELSKDANPVVNNHNPKE